MDAGSAGAATFPAFRRYIIDVSATRIVAMLHISSLGMARDDGDEDDDEQGTAPAGRGPVRRRRWALHVAKIVRAAHGGRYVAAAIICMPPNNHA